MDDQPIARTARVDVLLAGSTDPGVVSTCTLVRDGAVVAVVDPGMARRQADILEPLAALGIGPDSVTDVVFSHHHPDHTVNAALFPNARIHDHWAVYSRRPTGPTATPRAPSSPRPVRLLRTPGHTAEDIATVVGTADGSRRAHAPVVGGGRPGRRPVRARPLHALSASRARVLAIADRIVPGHGPGFVPDVTTPR